MLAAGFWLLASLSPDLSTVALAEVEVLLTKGDGRKPVADSSPVAPMDIGAMGDGLTKGQTENHTPQRSHKCGFRAACGLKISKVPA